MIYTVTFNPAIDYVVELVSFNIGEINRTTREYMNLGGKGVNVSRVLTNLEVPNVALGFVAGFTGDALRTGLERMGVKTDFISLEEGNTRINVNIKGVEETDINARGPEIPNSAIDELFKSLIISSQATHLYLPVQSQPLSQMICMRGLWRDYMARA